MFERIETVRNSEEFADLRPDQQRLVTLVYDGFARNGATLEGEAAERYAAINARLAELHTQFANNVLHDEEFYVLYLSEDQLSGLPQAFVNAAAAAATIVRNRRARIQPSDPPPLRDEITGVLTGESDNGQISLHHTSRNKPCVTPVTPAP